MTAAAVVDVIDAHRFTYASEDALQEGLAAALDAAGLHVQREVLLSARDRVDLLVGRVAVEVKVAGTNAGVFRQLVRYAGSGDVDELVLVTTRRRHSAIPRDVAGKPLTVVQVGGAA